MYFEQMGREAVDYVLQESVPVVNCAYKKGLMLEFVFVGYEVSEYFLCWKMLVFLICGCAFMNSMDCILWR